MSLRPSVLLWDVMDTLVHDPFWELPAFFGVASHRELFAHRPLGVWPAFERDEIDERAFFESSFPDAPASRLAELKEMFRAGYAWLPGMRELLEELRGAGVAMHALSNYPTWYRIIEEELALSDYLHWTFVSCLTGVRKPDPEAYLGPARRLGVPPERCLFIDNSERNVRGAEAVGMPALLFEGAPGLREALRRFDLPG